jgi:hypothetical protein
MVSSCGVRVRSPDLEERAQRILRERGGQAIRVHEIEIDKRLEDLPLSNLRPDPWLGGERLGSEPGDEVPWHRCPQKLMAVMAVAHEPPKGQIFGEPQDTLETHP